MANKRTAESLQEESHSMTNTLRITEPILKLANGRKQRWPMRRYKKKAAC